MKVAILGPVPEVNYCGGVAQFDLGLGSGFLSQGCEVVLLAKNCTESEVDDIFVKKNKNNEYW